MSDIEQRVDLMFNDIVCEYTEDMLISEFERKMAKRKRVLLSLLTEAETRGQLDTVKILKSRMIKHFTKWGGDQGNCVSEGTLDDYVESLTVSKLQEDTEMRKCPYGHPVKDGCVDWCEV